MKIDIDELMKNSFVICTDDDQYNKFYKRMKSAGFSIFPKLFKGFTIQNGVHKNAGIIKTRNGCNCSFTHLAIVKMAQSLNYPYVVIFEDDACPILNCVSKIKKYIHDIPYDTDMVKLGHLGFKTEDTKKEGNFFVNPIQYGSHAYVVFKRYYDDYQKISDKSLIIDESVMNSISHKILVVDENLFIQYCKFDNNRINSTGPIKMLLKNYNISYLEKNYVI